MDDRPEITQPEDEPQQPVPEESPQAETGQQDEAQPAPRPRSAEQALAEMRQSLREEEQQKDRERKPSLFSRLRSALKRKKDSQPPAEAYETPEVLLAEEQAGGLPEKPAMPEEEPADQAVSIEQIATEAAADVLQTEQEKTEDLQLDSSQQEFLEQLFSEPIQNQEEGPHRSILTRLEKEEPPPGEETKDIRRVALEDYSQEPAVAEVQPRTSLRTNLRRMWRDMRPLEKGLLAVVLAVISIAILLGAGGVAVNAILPEPPTPTPTPSGAPFPSSVNLPGGWLFPLNPGTVKDGRWDPARAEWLTGTEVNRWVALPWSVQLEAVVRTLKLDDPIILNMSNSASMIFKVRRVEQIPVDQINRLASNRPSLLLILSKQESELRWVVVAEP